MSDDAPKNGLLTSKLDFEGMDYSPSLLENQTMLDSARTLAAKNPSVGNGARKPRPPPPEFTQNPALLLKKRKKLRLKSIVSHFTRLQSS